MPCLRSFPFAPSLVFFLLCLAFSAQAAVPVPSEANAQILQLSASRFEEPLVATAATTPAEDTALLGMLTRPAPTEMEGKNQAINSYLTAYPLSGWTVALLTNLGLSYYQGGYFSKAIDAWERAWIIGKPVTEPRAKALVDRAFGELMRMHARLGHVERLTALFC